MNTLSQLAQNLRDATSPVFLTGAGISVASGIAPFRGTSEAVWSQTVMEMGTCRMFRKDPVSQWQWYLDRFDSCRTSKPNAAHHAITQIQSWKAAEGVTLRVITQNIDGLHVDASTQDVIEIHGAARKVRCSRDHCRNAAPRGTLPWDDTLFEAFRADPKMETLPRCSICGLILRPHVLWFDEVYVEHHDYRFGDARRAFRDTDLLIFVGTSFSVGITEMAIEGARKSRAPMWSIDPISAPPPSMKWLQAPAEEALPKVVELLG